MPTNPVNAASAEKSQVDPDQTTPSETQESLAEHEQAFGPALKHGSPTEIEGTVSGEQLPKGPQEQPIRHRAKSQQATTEDVPRIRELTRKLREAEAERDALKQAGQAQATQPTPSQATPPGPMVKPKLNDDNFSNLDDYLDARDSYNYKQWAAQQEREAQEHQIIASWKTRVDEAIKAHPDYEDVALKTPTKILTGSLMDAWILHSTAGAEILYAFQQDDELRERIAALPPIPQAEALTLLGQRLTQRSQAASTGSAVALAVPPVPRPPNPVRTGPIRPADEPPDDQASIREHEKFFGRSARRIR